DILVGRWFNPLLLLSSAAIGIEFLLLIQICKN
ncbi:hypothetical protein LCGC14_2936230, partial [marine sediment metagenome]